MEDKEFQIGKYKVKVLRDVCISAAYCVAFSPAVFELDGESKAVIKEGATDEETNILLATQSCPTGAIVITDAETGERIWPK